MTTLRMSHNPALPRLLYSGSERAPVTLFDVGCSGGVEKHWFRFGTALRATGFDPLIAEIERLRQLGSPLVEYEAAFVGCNGYDAFFPKKLRADSIAAKSNASFQRTSAAAYIELKRENYPKKHFNRGKEVVYSDRFVELDEFAEKAGIEHIDFLKIDTDGSDFQVLLGAQGLLSRGCLATCIEAQFHGAVHPYANTFCNIDALMRKLGFTLFDLEVLRYTRAALPGPFCYDIPAQTRNGAVQWAEAIYARDLADLTHDAKHGFSPAGEDTLKLATFFDIFGLQDCAAELLLARRHLVEPLTDVDQLLNALTPDTFGRDLHYDQFVATFRADPDSLLPKRLRVRVEGTPTKAT